MPFGSSPPKARGAVVLALAALLVSLSAFPAHAWAATGCRFASGSVQYLQNTSGTYHTTANAAMNAMNSATDIFFYTRSDLQEQLRYYVQNDGASGYDGLSTWRCSGGRTTYATSRLNTHYMASASTNLMRAIWTHEFGHAIGLAHAASSNVIMYSCPRCVYNSYGYYTMQADDRNGVNSLY